MKVIILFLIILLLSGCVQQSQTSEIMNELKLDNVTIKWLGHASLEIVGTKIIYIDPFVLPENPEKADYILITHDHFDHCAIDNINKIQKNETRIIGTIDCIKKLSGKINSIKANEFFNYPDGVRIDAIEAYNINKTYHPKDFGIGFIITIDNKIIYHAGDTDKIPEMENLKNMNIDVALLPIGGKYTMNVEEAAEAAKMFNPKIVIPMHYNSDKYGIDGIDANPEKLKELLKDTNIEVKILKPVV
ncbi:MAG: MBL fold metallo-hydrolase [Candidatus Aenigmatarchaeota archaeon]